MDNMELEYSYLDGVIPADVIPSYSTFKEDALYTIASIEESYTNTMKEIGVLELSSIMEATGKAKNNFSIKKLFEKFKDWVRDLWAKFVNLVQTARDRIVYFVANKFKTFKEKGITAKKIVTAIDKDKKKDAVRSDNRWKKFVGSYYQYSYTRGKAVSDNINAALKELTRQISKLKANSEYKDENIFDVDAIMAQHLNSLLRDGKITKDDVKKNSADLKEKVAMGVCEVVKITDPADYIKKNADVMIKDITGSKERFDKAIKEPYKKCKEKLDEAVKKAKGVVDTKEFRPLFKFAGTTSKMFSTVVGGIETAYIRTISWEYRMIFAASSLVTATTNESASFVDMDDEDAYQSTSFQTELSSLWDY